VEYLFGVWGNAFETRGQGQTEFGSFFDFRRCHICGREERKPANNRCWEPSHCSCINGFASITEWDGEKDLVAYRNCGKDVHIIYRSGKIAEPFVIHVVPRDYFNSLVKQRF